MPGGAYCCVNECKNNSKKAKRNGEQIVFFQFPKNPQRREQWISLCGIQDKVINIESKRICSKHFYPEDYEDRIRAKIMGTRPRKLTANAVPSVNLNNPKTLTKTTPKRPRKQILQDKNKSTLEQSEEVILIYSQPTVINPLNKYKKGPNGSTKPNSKKEKNIGFDASMLSANRVREYKLTEYRLKRQLQDIQEENILLKNRIEQFENNEAILKRRLFDLEAQLKENYSKENLFLWMDHSYCQPQQGLQLLQ